MVFLVPSPKISAIQYNSNAMPTGIMLIDCFSPVISGMSILNIGQVSTGKSSMALDLIINQQIVNPTFSKESVHCIYVCIGKSPHFVKKIISALQTSSKLILVCYTVAFIHFF